MGSILTDRQTDSCRNIGIDILRLFCCILIVYLHIPFAVNDDIGQCLSSFATSAVGVFFVISGYYYCNGVPKKAILKIFRICIASLLLYFVWNAFLFSQKDGNSLIDFFLQSYGTKKIVNFVLLNVPLFGGHLWYLLSILYVLLICYFIPVRVQDKLIYTVPFLYFLNCVFGVWANYIFSTQIDCWYTRNFLLCGFPYFLLGRHLKLYGSKVSHRIYGLGIIFGAVASLIECVFLLKNGGLSMHDNFGATVVLVICLFGFFSNSSFSSKGALLLSVVGKKYSLIIYVIHPIVISLVLKVFHLIGVYDNFILLYVSSLIVSFAISIIYKSIKSKLHLAKIKRF